MITTALATHTPAAWVAADEVYGGNPHLRTTLEEHRLGYVMAVARTERLMLPHGPATVGELAVLAPGTAWQRLSAGPGAKGQRFYDWALIDAEPTPDG